MKRKLLITIFSAVVVVAGVAILSAFESHIINVTAHIENALRVHPKSFDFGVVFPQEYFAPYVFQISTSDSFCEKDQTRVLSIDYKIVRKPKPFDPADYEYCYEHRNDDPKPADYYVRCYPSMCAAVSAHPEYPGGPLDIGFDSFTDPDVVFGRGHLHKKISLVDPEEDNNTDVWRLDLDVPCFEGMCAQDWTHSGYELPAAFEGQAFGCDLWIEVTDIY